MLASCCIIWGIWFGRGKGAYSVCGGIFLFCSDYVSTALSSVDGTFAFDNGFFLRRAAAGFGADLGDGVPFVVHGDLAEGFFRKRSLLRFRVGLKQVKDVEVRLNGSLMIWY